jgi:cysteine synthase A
VLASLAAGVHETPILALGSVAPGHFLKLEHLSPTGSGKDRLAIFAIDALLRSGRLVGGQAIVLPSTGNTAVSLAWAASTRGHQVHAVIPRASALEFRQLLALHGARVVLSDAEQGIAGARTLATSIASELKACLWDPFADDIALDGLEPLARECAAFHAQRPIAGIVVGLGSGITVRALRRFAPALPVIAVEPTESPVQSGGPRGPHKLHGIGVGFASVHLEGISGVTLHAVGNARAWAIKRQAAREAGLFVGPTTGAVLAAMIDLTPTVNLPLLGIAMDSGERAFSLEGQVS